ncbi:MAG: RluA family pseudouridine synthase [Sideroxydans sp.]
MPDFPFQDEHLLIVNKPAGLLSVPGRGEDKQDCLWARIRRDFPEALVVHRLDMATSGLMLFARNRPMQRQLSILFQQRQICKRYEAVVAGRMKPAEGEIDLPLCADWPQRPRQRIDTLHGKPALTRYRVLDAQDSRTRVALEPVTGRTHQLRLHLAAIGYPILGDALYGEAASAPRLLLHACMLGFTHPVSGEPLCIEHAPPF